MSKHRIGYLLSLLITVAGCSHQHGDHDHGYNHDHSHVHTRHHGISVPLFSGQQRVAFAELKLHDDKGDLELWLTMDEIGGKPFDLLLDSDITVSFPKLAKEVTLKVRNRENNEDEGGKGNIRDGKTNYFIFPGETVANAVFLTGKDFSSEAVISFVADGVKYSAEPFMLRPHTH